MNKIKEYQREHEKRLSSIGSLPYSHVWLGDEMKLPRTVENLDQAFQAAQSISDPSKCLIAQRRDLNEIWIYPTFETLVCVQYRHTGEIYELEKILPAPELRDNYAPQFYVIPDYMQSLDIKGELVPREQKTTLTNLANAAALAVLGFCKILSQTGWQTMNEPIWLINDQYGLAHPHEVIYSPTNGFKFSSEIQKAIAENQQNELGQKVIQNNDGAVANSGQNKEGFIVEVIQELQPLRAKQYRVFWRNSPHTQKTLIVSAHNIEILSSL